MSKKKKIFKQKIRQMLSEIERGPVTILKEPTEQKEGAKPAQKTLTLAIAPIKITKSEIKKIALIFLIIIVLIISVAIVSQRTNYISIIADKLYNFAKLGD